MNGQLITTWNQTRAHIAGSKTVGRGRDQAPIALCGTYGLAGWMVERHSVTPEGLAKLPLCKRCQAKHDKGAKA